MLGNWLGRLLGAQQRRRNYLGNWAIEAFERFGCRLRHFDASLAQVKVRKASVENATGVVNLTVANQVKAFGGHVPSLPAGKLGPRR